MKKFSLFFVLIFTLSTLLTAPMGAFADVSEEPLLMFSNSDGLTRTSTNYDIPGNELTDGNSTLLSNANIKANFSTTTGSYLKSSDDTALYFTYTPTSNSAINWGAPYIKYNATVATGTYKYFVWEFDVLFGNENSAATVGYNDGTTQNYINILASSNAKSVTSSATNNSITYNTAGVKKWHKVRTVARIDGTAEEIKLYIDDFNTEVLKTTNTVTLSGTTNAGYNGLFFPAAADTTPEVYLDNIKVYLGNAPAASWTKPSATFSDTTLGTLSGNTITLAKKATASELSSALAVQNGTLAGIYNSDMTTAVTGTIGSGAVAVLKSSDGSVFSYYDITPYTATPVYTYTKTYTGSTSLTLNNSSSFPVTLSYNQQAPHKGTGNVSYKISDTVGTSNYNWAGAIYLTPSIQYNLYGSNSTTTTAYGRIIVEFNILPVYGNFTYGLRFRNGSSQTTVGGMMLHVGNNTFTPDSTFAQATLETGKWSHIVYEFANDGTNTDAKLWINGVATTCTIPAGSGLQAGAIYSPIGAVYANSSTYEFYLDDITIGYNTAGKSYADCPRESSVIEGASGNMTYTSSTITVPHGTTASELVSALTAYNAESVGVYRGTTAVTGKVQDNDVVALISNDNGVATYYAVNVAEIDAEISVSGNDVTVTVNAVSPSNTLSGKLVVAAYDANGMLVSDKTDFTFSGAAVSKTFTNILANANGYTKIKAFYINNFDDVTPYCDAIIYPEQ